MYKSSIFTPDVYQNSYAYKPEDLRFSRMRGVGNCVWEGESINLEAAGSTDKIVPYGKEFKQG